MSPQTDCIISNYKQLPMRQISTSQPEISTCCMLYVDLVIHRKCLTAHLGHVQDRWRDHHRLRRGLGGADRREDEKERQSVTVTPLSVDHLEPSTRLDRDVTSVKPGLVRTSHRHFGLGMVGPKKVGHVTVMVFFLVRSKQVFSWAPRAPLGRWFGSRPA